MNYAKKLGIIGVAVCCCCGGCASRNFVSYVHELAQDHAAARLVIVTPQGTLEYDRAMPDGTNTMQVGGGNGLVFGH